MRVPICAVVFWRTWLAAWLLLAAPASATSILVDDFESGHLGFDDMPPPGGEWDGYPVACASSGCTIGPAAGSAGAHRGAFGMFFQDTHNVAGAGLQGEVFGGVNISTATLYGRFWFRATQSNGLGRAIITQVTDVSPAEDSILDLSFNPGVSGGTFEISGQDNAGTSRTNAVPFPLATNNWYLIEFEIKGIGTSNGSLKGYIDGVLKAAVTLNLTGRTATTLTLGEPASADRTFTGRLNFDDYRADTAPLASKWVLTPPVTITGPGSCMPITATLINSIDGAPAASPYTQVGSLTRTGSGGGFYSDPDCTVPATTLALAVNLQGASIYFKPDEAGVATLSIGQLDFLTGTRALQIPNTPSAGGSDGQAIPGASGGGAGTGASALECPADNPFCGDDLKVGSSCAAGAGTTPLAALGILHTLALFFRRRYP